LTERVEVFGVELAVSIIGRESGNISRHPVLVFLHQGLGSIAQWKTFPAALAEATGLPAVLYERLGHGESDPLPEDGVVQSFSDEARIVLPELLRKLGIGHPVLVGHSDGATIALLYAAEFPDIPLEVVSEAAHVLVEETTMRSIRNDVERYDSADLHEKLARFHGSNTASLFQSWSATWEFLESSNWNICGELESIRCPLLLIQGEKDEYGTPGQIEAVRAAVRAESETMLLSGIGHVPHLQAEQEVLTGMAGFVNKLTGGEVTLSGAEK